MDQLFEPVEITDFEYPLVSGWIPQPPDLRDYTEETPEVKPILEHTGLTPIVNMSPGAPLPEAPPSQIDLRKYCSPIENQRNLGSCSAHAAMSIIEYFQRRRYKKHINGSRLFVYKTTRNLMGVTGDTGAWLRTVMGALRLCGVPPEKYWGYTTVKPNFDQEPTSFVYSIADNYEAIRYFAHDPWYLHLPGQRVLDSVKRYLWAGIPSMFGFYGFPSFNYTSIRGGIPYPCPREAARWAHAIAAVGYDDTMKIKNTSCGYETTGALLIRNSWGVGWGDKGYGWLPYEYVRKRLARDFWSLITMDWVDTDIFKIS
jgi:C1A family cysteine protease